MPQIQRANSRHIESKSTVNNLPKPRGQAPDCCESHDIFHHGQASPSDVDWLFEFIKPLI